MAFEKTLKDIAKITGGKILGDESAVIKRISGIEDAKRGDISFVANERYFKHLSSTEASAVIVPGKVGAIKGKNLLVVDDPYLAIASILRELEGATHPLPGVHPKSEIHPSAVLGRDVSIQAYAVLEEGVKIGDRVIIYPGVYIGKNAEIGDSAVIYSNVSIREGVIIGKRAIIHCNSVIGSDGFGYAKEGDVYRKIPQIGIVRIGDDVEIGACVTIDRATFGETLVEKGTKIDNLVQIAHNVKIGENSLIVAQVGISGSTSIGNRVTLAGQAGVAGHIAIADDCVIGAKSGVSNDIKTKGAYTGYPATPHNEWLKTQGIISRLPQIKDKLAEIEKRLGELEKIQRE